MRRDESSVWNWLAVLALTSAAVLSGGWQIANAQNQDRINRIEKMFHRLFGKGDYENAEKVAKGLLALRTKRYGQRHREVGLSLNDLGAVNMSLGRFAKGLKFLEQSLEIRIEALGPNHPTVAQTLNNTARLFHMMGRSDDAIRYYNRSISILRQRYGSKHSELAAPLNNLGLVFLAAGRLADAEKLFKTVLKLTLLNRRRLEWALTAGNLAEVYLKQRRLIRAEKLAKQGLATLSEIVRQDHHMIGTHSILLGEIYEAQTRLEEASTAYEKGLSIRIETRGPTHPLVSTAYSKLARLSFLQSDWSTAAQLWRKSTDITKSRAKTTLRFEDGSTSGDGTDLAEKLKARFHGFLKSSYRQTMRNPKLDKQLSREAFLNAQWLNFSQTAKSIQRMSSRTAHSDADLAKLVREYQDLAGRWKIQNRSRVSVISLPNEPKTAVKLKEVSGKISTTESEMSDLRNELARRFPQYVALNHHEPLAIAKVQRLLKGKEALVLFVDTTAMAPAPEETFIWVITKTDSRWVRSPLGSKALKEHIDALRCGLDFEGAWKGTHCFELLNVVFTEADRWAGKPLPFQLSRAHEVYKSLFGKVEDLIKGKDLLIVPSGPLTQLPIQVLVTVKPTRDELSREAFQQASWLAKHHAITILPSVSSLVALRAHAKSSKAGKPFIGFGNPLLDGDPASAKVARAIKGCAGINTVQTAALRVTRSPVMPLRQIDGTADLEALREQLALPETANELCSVARNAGVGNTDVYLGDRTTETAIKSLSESGNLRNYKVLHFATHGALAGEMRGSTEPGLILTPPDTATARDDGYLSASEVASLKLDADWVILSACNTAGGEAKNAEALSGLAKAFFYAGARSLLVSHWYVNSQATVALVTKAFDALKRDSSIGRAGALRQAMLSLIAEEKYMWHPSNWAPFVVVGEGK